VKAEDLENKLFEVQQQSDELSKETQERASKINELQEMIARYYEFIALEFGQIYL
jgi:myosin-5